MKKMSVFCVLVLVLYSACAQDAAIFKLLTVQADSSWRLDSLATEDGHYVRILTQPGVITFIGFKDSLAHLNGMCLFTSDAGRRLAGDKLFPSADFQMISSFRFWEDSLGKYLPLVGRFLADDKKLEYPGQAANFLLRDHVVYSVLHNFASRNPYKSVTSLDRLSKEELNDYYYLVIVKN